jgi:hypothetical protein
MKPSFPVVGIIILFAISSLVADPAVPITKETARNAIVAARQEPLSPRGRAAGEVVRSYAEKNEDVIVQVNPKVAPFLTNMTIPLADRTLLLDAFVIGNVDSQFLHNEKKDDPYAGALEVIETYRKMQKRDTALSLPEIENFIALEKRNELKKYITSPEGTN